MTDTEMKCGPGFGRQDRDCSERGRLIAQFGTGTTQGGYPVSQ